MKDDKKTVCIDGIIYIYDGTELENRIKQAVKEYQMKSDKNGKTFWDDLKGHTGGEYDGLATSTVKGWYKSHAPRDVC